MHRVEVVHEALHRLMGIALGALIGLFEGKTHGRSGELTADAIKTYSEGFGRSIGMSERGLEVTECFDEALTLLVREASPREKAVRIEEAVGELTDEGLTHARGHKEVEGWDSLPAMLFVLIRLEDDRRECGVALDILWGTDAPILRMEASLEEVRQIVLHARSGLRRIVV